MPKLRQIPFLLGRPCADGTTTWHWKPSKKLRDAGFANVRLGQDYGEACKLAIDLNRQLDAWKAGAAEGKGAGQRAVAPRLVRFGELVRRYRASHAFTDLRASTQREYNCRLNDLEHWAMDGELFVRDIDEAMVRDLRDAKLDCSRHVAGATIRVLRLLLSWAVTQDIVKTNVAMRARIPEAAARSVITSDAVRDAIVAAADKLKLADVTLAVQLGFWTLQRQADILSFGRLAWRELRNVDVRHAPLLADPRGRVMAFRLRQHKTAAWVDAPVPPFLHGAIEAAMKANAGGFVFAHPERPEVAMPGWMFQRRFRQARDAAHTAALEAGDAELVAELEQCQFRDLRRTGMTFYGNAGARTPWITALSGHAVLGRKTILDTYMPGNTDAAIACVATGLRALAEREEAAADA